jgi:RimJ/RimL family protein N-acetyltransferase
MLVEAQDHHFQDVGDLRPVGAYEIASGGIAPPEVLQMLRSLAAEIGEEHRPSAWWIVENEEVVGLCSLKSAPSGGGTVEIGYGVAPSWQSKGAATRAVSDLISWARSASLKSLTAETAVDNIASQRVLANNGFIQAGHRTDDEDGDMICWCIDL